MATCDCGRDCDGDWDCRHDSDCVCHRRCPAAVGFPRGRGVVILRGCFGLSGPWPSTGLQLFRVVQWSGQDAAEMSLAWRVAFGEGERVVLSGRPWADVADGDDVDVERFLAVEHTSLPGAPDAGHAFLPSRGSGGHDTGACRPCVWHWKPQGCFRGSECRHCHLCPRGELGIRRRERAATLRPIFAQSPTARHGREGPSIPGGSEDGGVPSLGGAAGMSSSVSAGSDVHGTGDCRPCAWFWKKEGCQNGEACRRCHLCSEGELLRRWKKKHTDRLSMRRRELQRGP